MTKSKFLQSFNKCIISMFLCLVALNNVFAQSDEDEGTPVLENGVPMVKYRGPTGFTTFVFYTMIDNKPAIKIPVYHYGHGFGGFTGSISKECFGYLIITKDSFTYEPEVAKFAKDTFKFNLTELKKSEYKDMPDVWEGNWWLKIDGGGKTKAYCSRGKRNGEWGIPLGVNSDLRIAQQALKDFDTTSKKLQLLTAGLVPDNQSNTANISGSGNDANMKQTLYERFINNRKTNPDVAYQAAKAYFQLFPNDSDENVDLMKKWAAAYEKVKGGNNQ